MLPFAGLRLRAIERDGNIALARKRQDIGCVILIAELAVEGLQLRIVRDPAVEIASARDPRAQSFGKGFQAGAVERGRLAPVSYKRVGFHSAPVILYRSRPGRF